MGGESKISSKIGNKHKFKIKYKNENSEDSGMFLLFGNKFDLFKFLVSEDASDIDHLQFDEKKIESFKGEETDSLGRGLNRNDGIHDDHEVIKVQNREEKEASKDDINKVKESSFQNENEVKIDHKSED